MTLHNGLHTYKNMIKLHTCLELVDRGPPGFSAAFPLPLSLSPDHVSPLGLPTIKTQTNNITVTLQTLYMQKWTSFVHSFLG